jgi:hypothetical protein
MEQEAGIQEMVQQLRQAKEANDAASRENLLSEKVFR